MISTAPGSPHPGKELSRPLRRWSSKSWTLLPYCRAGSPREPALVQPAEPAAVKWERGWDVAIEPIEFDVSGGALTCWDRKKRKNDGPLVTKCDLPKAGFSQRAIQPISFFSRL